MKKYDGKCACGDIEYSFEGEPINSAFCYCSECQKHTGSEGIPRFDILPPDMGG